MKKMGIIIAAVAVVAVAGGVLGYHAFANRTLSKSTVIEESLTERIPVDTEDGNVDIVSGDETVTTTEETELMAVVDSEEEAQEIADLYGIRLSSYAFGVAIYTTDQDVDALLKMGEEKGYPELSINTETYELFED